MEQLKKKILLYNTYISYYTSQNTFKSIYILSVIIAIYGGMMSKGSGDIFNAFLRVFCFRTFVISFFLLSIVNTLMFIKFLDGNYFFYSIRINNKTKILKEKIVMSIILGFYFNILFFMIVIPLMGVFKGYYMDGEIYFNYDVSKTFYFFFSFIRLLLINCLLIIYNVIFYEKFKFKVIILDFLFLLGIRLADFKTNLKVSFNFYNFILLYKFESFKYDIISTLIVLVLLFLISYFFVKRIRRISFNVASILFSDFKFILNKKINIFVFYLILNLVLFFFCKNIKNGYENILGLGFDFNNFNLIFFLIFLFNDVTYIFILVKLLEKDMEYMYSIIFSRLKVCNWFLYKVISFVSIVFLLKLAYYFIFFLIFRISISLLTKYFLVDILNILLIEVSIIIVSLFKKKKCLYIVLFLVMFVLLPKNIMSLYNYKYFVICLFFIINIGLFIIFKLKNNTIFSLIGGNYDRNKKYC